MPIFRLKRVKTLMLMIYSDNTHEHQKGMSYAHNFPCVKNDKTFSECAEQRNLSEADGKTNFAEKQKFLISSTEPTNYCMSHSKVKKTMDKTLGRKIKNISMCASGLQIAGSCPSSSVLCGFVYT